MEHESKLSIFLENLIMINEEDDNGDFVNRDSEGNSDFICTNCAYNITSIKNSLCHECPLNMPEEVRTKLQAVIKQLKVEELLE